VSERSRTTVGVLNPDRSKGEAQVEWWSDGVACIVNVTFDGVGFHGSSSDFFAALGEARRQLERTGHRLLCYGASRNVWPSGMSRDMGRGLKAYQVTLGQRGGVLRGIFANGPDVVPSTVEEQAGFSQQWFSSIR
jgi:hypothetical protein